MSQDRIVVFETSGPIDIRAFTIFGVNAKPNATNPIGYFGTGLKFAIATLLRHDCEVTMQSNKHFYRFMAQKEKFRDKDVDHIYLYDTTKRFRKTTILPFTIDLGRNWELWQAFRELYANTRDEAGIAYVQDQDIVLNEPDKTYIMVKGEMFVEEFLKKDEIFLPEALANQVSQETVQVFERPSKYIYWRGVRVLELQEPSNFTYNILRQVVLTEDRTVAEYPAMDIIRSFVKSSENKAFLRKVLSAVSGLEREIDYTYINYTTPSQAFLETARQVRSPNPSVGKLQEQFAPKLEPIDTYNALVKAIKERDWSRAWDIISEHSDEVLKWLELGHSEELARKFVDPVLIDSFQETHTEE